MSLPEDVIEEILSRLPVLSLIRFKSVCKSWKMIIKNPAFISKHHQTIASTEGSETLLVNRRDNATNKRVVSLLRKEGKDAFALDQDLPTVFNNMFNHVRLIGPCNGIVCLYGYPDNIALWNPRIRDFKILPISKIPRSSKVLGGDIGLGFDSETRDFKVMQILFCGSVNRVEIYSLKTNSWRKYKGVLPADIMYNNLWSMVHKNEIFCWLAQDISKIDVILSFHMINEIFQITPLPPLISTNDVFGGITRAIMPLKQSSIGLIVYPIKDSDKVFDVWIANELGGNVDLWCKIASIGPISSVERPLALWENDEFVLENSRGELVMYNCSNQEIKNLGFYGKRSRLEVLVYKESLFTVSKIYTNL
ncbi:hypothetical protein ABFX02_13G011200 [Erythranthe guttata]